MNEPWAFWPEQGAAGQPLRAVALLLGGWIALRLLWPDALSERPVPATGNSPARVAGERPSSTVPLFATAPVGASAPMRPPTRAATTRYLPDGASLPWLAAPQPQPERPDLARPAAATSFPSRRASPDPEAPPRPAGSAMLDGPAMQGGSAVQGGRIGPPSLPARGAMLRRLPRPGAQTRLAAAYALLARARYGLDPFASPPGRGLAVPLPLDPPEPPRLSGEGWLFLRDDRARVPIGGPGRYGGSQAAALLRWRLTDRPTHVTAFARTTGAGRGAAEVAVGVSLSPFGKVPVSLAIERRLARAGGDATATYAVLAPRPRQLPGGFRLDGYGAAGMVQTRRRVGFHEAGVRLSRALGQEGGGGLELGAGLWAAGQDETHRLDLGPSLSVPLAIADRQVRLQLDWRQRVAGNAGPGSGPALTLATGF